MNSSIFELERRDMSRNCTFYTTVLFLKECNETFVLAILRAPIKTIII